MGIASKGPRIVLRELRRGCTVSGREICDAVQARAGQDKNHGVILIPEGIIESIPEVYALLKLLLHPESDDSAQLSQIETEKLLAYLVETEMNKRLKEGTYKGKKFNAICHFFGYQARGSLPSKFDCDYAYVLGHICYHILAAGLNGYMATVTNLKSPVNKWKCGAAPITAMMTVKNWSQNAGSTSTSIGRPAIHPAMVDLKGKAYESVMQFKQEQDKNHGAILIPEGIIESIPEVYALLKLLLHPESDDSAQLSQIETEKLLAYLVETEMNKRLKEGTYKGKKFNAICHFFGYQARGSLPSKFDCDYAYVLGHICYHILVAGLNGYMATVTNLKSPVNKWKCGAAPITAMMTVKNWSQNAGSTSTSIGRPAIHPAMVDLKGKAYEQNAEKFLMEDLYRNPGPLQYDGPGADAKAVSLCVEDQDYMGRIKKLQEYLDQVRTIVKPGCSQDVLKAALSVMASVTDVLTTISSSSNGGQQTA
ncbi:hypothetical protein F2Q69_00061151 [Brassica cretica]|uniref:Phosphofructokinase domain-containing protein n=1 Tax=Brassica cretica TaxID=69181 RepID=A0A8S9RCR9_BRACR|nr:hypothetical protein F2Q69_00061151 [Brassica cretica]